MESLPITAAQRATLLEAGRWQVTSNGMVVRPPLGLVRDLNENSRRQLYQLLALTPGNLPQRFPYAFRGRAEDWLAGADLPPNRAREWQRLIYRQGDVCLFADLPYVQLTASSNEVRLLVQHLARVPTLLLDLEIDAHSDLTNLAHYWVLPECRAEVEPMLQSLARVPHGSSINVASFLPPLPRLLLYSFPRPGQDDFPAHADCVWTSMNFFNTQPDNRYVDEQFTQEALTSKFHRVPKATAFGDVIMLYQDGTRGGMRMVHMCVHVADDVVFTKNGGDVAQPWVLMRLPDVVALFASETGLKTVVFRRNG